MEYNININQYALIGLSPGISLNEAATLWYVYRMCTSKSSTLERIKIEDEEYTWFNLNHFMQQMPLLKIKSKGAASKIITNLEKFGFIKKYTRKLGCKLFITYTSKLDAVFNSKKTVHENERLNDKAFTTGNTTVHENERNRSPQETNHYNKSYIPNHSSNEPDQIILPFNEFWSLYPKKVNKEKAKTAFLKLKPDNEFLKKMIDAVEKQKRWREEEKRSGQFVPEWPYPATWLNQKRWEDEVELSDRAETGCPF